MANPSTQPATEPNWKTPWRGLLHPNLDDGLRRHIIHYGQMTAAIVDLFDMQPTPNRNQFFTKACLVEGNPWKYEVKAYINTSVWIGYVAVSNDEAKTAMGRRDIFVGWRGTRTTEEWLQNVNIVPITAEILSKEKDTKIKVHEGFYKAYTYGGNSSPREKVREEISSILNDQKYQSEEISITVGGFSLGGAIATLNAMDLVVNGFNKNTTGNKLPVSAFTFGAPSVFIYNGGLNNLLNSPRLEKLRILRITNPRDPVPKLPFPYLGYGQVGSNELQVDHTKSKYFKESKQGKALVDLPEIPKPPAGVDLNDLYTIEIKKGGDGDTNREGRGLLNDFISKTYNWFEKWFDAEQYWRAHNMDVYMHGVKIHGKENDDGYNPDEYQYHDIALVNKYLDLLKANYGIPANWWGKNGPIENMVQLPNGKWKYNQSS